MSRYPPLKVIRFISFPDGTSKPWDECTEEEHQSVVENIRDVLTEFAEMKIRQDPKNIELFI